jgi:hypothetical protein
MYVILFKFLASLFNGSAIIIIINDDPICIGILYQLVDLFADIVLRVHVPGCKKEFIYFRRKLVCISKL